MTGRNPITWNKTVTDPEEMLSRFFAAFPDYNGEEQRRIREGWLYFCAQCRGRTRASGEPWRLHPLRTACILAESGLDADTVISGILHSVLELHPQDNGATAEAVRGLLGDSVLNIVTSTARITKVKFKNKTLQQADSMRKMLFAMTDDIRVIMVKLADRLDRMRNLSSVDAEEQKQIAQEAIEIWAPLAYRLGMSAVKSELEDLSLKFSNPQAWAYIKRLVSLKEEERAGLLRRAEEAIRKEADRAGLEVRISSRAKHFYSIYQKMRKRNKQVDELYDLLALRIICQAQGDCYTLIGIVHGIWKPLEGHFKDYIAMPKANGYQSLHTAVLCEGMPLEIQVRTQEMHDIAEHGVASHWLYKRGSNRDTASVKNLSIISRLQELKAEHLNDTPFFAEIRDELLGDSIFLFTPKDDVIELPAGSTAIDFSYAIHSQIGEKIVGAKANGQIIPLSRPLANTQIIEILTSPQAHPTVNQLTMVKTAKARSKIRGWLLQHGLIEEKPPRAEQPKETKPPRSKHKKGAEAPQEPRAEGRIIVAGSANFLVAKARCCNPVYGEPIVGFVSRGRGVIVHRADCPMFLRIPNNRERTLPASWEEVPAS
ncbi:MAG: RelA/SpoT family protein [Spirochaetaceae bacterium]|jgi:GTP pyrophosphokinase|nr:RelA/SpoT family protein [Spirochaetaceae bacterium]